jgi:hypothetical protein
VGPSEEENGIPNERDIPPSESDQARSGESSRPMEATRPVVKPPVVKSEQGWPDENELLKRIQRDDGHTVQNELHYLAGGQGTELSEQEPAPECVVSLEVYGKIELNAKRARSTYMDPVAYESGQLKRLTLSSSHLRGLLQELVDFYPAVDLTQAPLVFHRPYSFLFHFLPRLKELSKGIGPDDCRYSDLRVLLFLCDRYLSEPFGSIRSALDSGRVPFSALEILFRPGIKLLARDYLGQWQVFMCVEATQECKEVISRGKLEDDTPRNVCKVVAWHLAWNPVFKRFERQLIKFWVGIFDGSRPIDTLPVFPLESFGDESSRNTLTRSLIERGHRWHQLMSEEPTCWVHEGASVEVPGKAYLGSCETSPPRRVSFHPIFGQSLLDLRK